LRKRIYARNDTMIANEILHLLDKPDGLRLYINAPDEVYLERQESFERLDAAFSGTDEVKEFLHSLGRQVGRELTLKEKAVHFRLPGGKRVAAFNRPGAPNPVVCIAK
jgi:Flp pilus assembly CpaF family ATPase